MRADPVIVAALISQQDHGHMRHRVRLNQSLDMLQPPSGVRDLLRLTTIENKNQTVHIQRDVTLDNGRTSVKTKDGELQEREGRMSLMACFPVYSMNYCNQLSNICYVDGFGPLPEINLSRL